MKHQETTVAELMKQLDNCNPNAFIVLKIKGHEFVPRLIKIHEFPGEILIEGIKENE